MADCHIRVLTAADAGLLLAAEAELFDDPVDARMTAAFLAEPRHHMVAALENSCLVGFVSAVEYSHPDKTRGELFINEVSVVPRLRERRLGSRMLAQILDVGRALGCFDAWVLTDRENHAAMRLYAAAGGKAGDHVMFTFDLTA